MKTAEEIVKEKNRKILTCSEDTLVIDAIKKMNENKVGSIFIERDGKIVGIWTERDLLKNSEKEGFDPRSAKIGDYMTTNLVSAPHTATCYNLVDIFLGRRIRHLLIEKEGEFIGLVSPGDIMKAYIQEKDRELRELNAMVSWEYYENWGWKKEK